MQGCIEFRGAKSTGGYGIQSVDSRTIGAHRVTWSRRFGPIPKGMMVLHMCDNPPCINHEHLFLGTQAENMADMRRKGRARYRVKKHGTCNVKKGYACKLKEEQVIAIMARLLVGGISKAELGREYGVTAQNVSCIWVGRSWNHLFE